MVKNILKCGKEIILQARHFGFKNIINNWRSDFGKYEIVKPGKVSSSCFVPVHIDKPVYYKSGEVNKLNELVNIKTNCQIEKIKKSCQLAANILNKISILLKPGISTEEIDKIVHSMIIENNAYPSPLNYKLFPKSICTSVNNIACHGIPDDRKLKDGDIINVDITVYLNGYHGDCSKTFLIGNVDQKGCQLVLATKKVLHEAIKVCKPGVPFSKIGHTIENEADKLGYTVLPQFCGHGIGSNFHEPPDIFHFKNNYPGCMESGMIFTIEPVLGQGSNEIEILEDNWTCTTTDNSRTAQEEHTILINHEGAEILTLHEQEVNDLICNQFIKPNKNYF